MAATVGDPGATPDPAAFPATATAAGGLGPGLTSAEARARLARDGPNLLPGPERPPSWRRLVAELVHFFALLLWGAGTLAFVAGMPQLGVAIFVVVLVNAAFAFVQEERAERASERLGGLLPTRAIVRRDGVLSSVDAADLVVGDVVVLSPGDRVGADLVVDEGHDLGLDESTLTGESVPVAVAEGDPAWAGTFVTAGEGRAVVVATGARTRLAGIARLTAGAARPHNPLAREMDRVVRIVALLAASVGVAFFGLSLLLGTPARDGFLFAVGVTVALVPEGLLPTLTLSLALGAQRMAARQALVRHLDAVEALGATTFVCTDKTGTLTRNEMVVVRVWTPVGVVTLDGPGYGPSADVQGDDAARVAATTLADVGRAASVGRVRDEGGQWSVVGDPMDGALDALAHRLRAGVVAEDPPVLRRFAFDSARRRSSVLTADHLLVKGAPDAVLPRCGETGATAVAASDAMAAGGLRVLAIARRRAGEIPDAADADLAEQDLELLGLVGIHDPPRPEVFDAMARCRRAGIRVAMLTGDHPATARAIAEEVGMIVGSPRVLVGAELPAEEAALAELVDHDGVVVSRVTPEDKLRIARALQSRHHVVAMTGDGVNDGPALRAADIGVAMGRSGTDVAREAADLVLLDDDFGTIVAAIEQGRATFANIRRFLTYHLTDNVAELTPFVVWALSGGRFPLALGVLQILCLDIGTDVLPALALGGEQTHGRAMEEPPTQHHLIDRSVLARVFGVLGPVEAAVEMSAFVVALLAAGWRPGASFPEGHALLAASGAAFAAVVLGQAANAFACRSTRVPPWRLSAGPNRLVRWAVGIELLALAGMLAVGPVARLLDQAVPPLPALLVAGLAVPAVLGADATHKAWVGRRSAPPEAGPGTFDTGGPADPGEMLVA